ncbi:nucleolar protein NOP2 [Histoplasma capsulatum var. duboisii H88]|uniref:Nucleolar protein NOP2 n=1 Tax=Ajellomyces capsulatus (strain H88) TaxID=544711 RepID=F0US42_AJEC8|nr:nucleolar protein NOP2 [Histoplasma capsulatum var. duboisii H88]
MVNLRSGGTPDLTKEYVPTRRRTGGPQTPEAQELNAGLPTPATNRRVIAPGAFEPDETIEEESNDSNNEYEDPVDNNAMSDNAGGPGGRNDVSEETCMRLEIVRLQHEVEQMKASRANATSASDENFSPDLAEYLQQMGRTSALVKLLGEFRDQVRSIKKPVILTGSTNYPMWKEEILLAARQSQTRNILEEKQTGPKENASNDMQRFWNERNMWLYNYMWSSIAPQAKSHFTIPKDSELSAYALWQIIEDNFAERPDVRRTRLYREMTGMTAKSKGSDRAFIERLIAIRTDYIRLGYRVEDFMFFDCLLTGVSKGWASFIKNRLDQVAKDNSQPLEDDFLGLCRDILLRLPTANESTTDTPRNPTNNAQDTDKKDKKGKDKDKEKDSKSEKKSNETRTCFHCQRIGHIQNDCWKKYPEKRPSYPNNDNKEKDKVDTSAGTAPVHNVVEQVFCITEKAYMSGHKSIKDTWILDSGSGAHATPHKDLVVAKPQKYTVKLEMADGSVVPAAAIGDTMISVEGADMLLSGVRYVPKLEVNLMSMGKLVRQGFTFKQLAYGNNHAMLFMSPDRTFSFTAKLNENDIYEVEKPPTFKDLICFALSNGKFEPANAMTDDSATDAIMALPKNDIKVIELTMMQWHQKLGHLNPADIAKMAADPRLGMRIIGQRTLPFCKVCVQAKMTRPTFAPMIRATKPAMRLFIDLAGGGKTLFDGNDVPTRGGASYWLGITDDATRYRWAILMMSKGESTARLMNFITSIEATTQRRVGTLHWDGGSEFKGQDLRAYCQSKGIAYEITTPDTPQSNGPAERANRIVAEKTRSLLFDSGLTKELWGEAMQAAIMMINTSPTSTKIFGCKQGPQLPLTPFEAWTGVQPTAHWMRRWGCKVYKKDLKVTNKLADRTDGKEWQLVGYQGLHQYRIWDPINRRLEIARDVVFDEALDKGETTPVNVVKQTSELPQELDVLDAADGWQHCLLRHLAKVKPDILKMIANGDLEGAIDPTYLLDDETQLGDDEDCVNEDDPVLSTLTDRPTTMAEAKRSPDWDYWLEAMKKEVSMFERKKTYIVVEKTPEMDILTGKWVFDRKLNNKGETIRFRARWVVKGFLQQQGVHYTKSYAAVVSGPMSRSLFAISAAKGWKAKAIDYVSAFLNGILPQNEMVYMQLPTGIKHGRGALVGLLRQSLYGMKQAARVWYFLATEHLTTLGFKISPYDGGFLYHPIRKIYLTLHVDDCRVTGPQGQQLDWILAEIAKRFETKNVEESKPYLGMEVRRQMNGDLSVTQNRYIDEILEDFGLDKVNPASTPMAAGIRLEFSPDEDSGLDDDFTATRYRQGLGSLQYLVSSSRPDLAFAVNYLSRFNSRPHKACWAALKHVLCYVKKTKDHGILYKKQMDEGLSPVAYSDSDWAGADPQYKSTTGYIILINGSPISWRSQRQTSVAKSTTEAEYIAASEAACELIWLNDMLYDAGLVDGKAKIGKED